jgi:hypothetical protein
MYLYLIIVDSLGIAQAKNGSVKSKLFAYYFFDYNTSVLLLLLLLFCCCFLVVLTVSSDFEMSEWNGAFFSDGRQAEEKEKG